MDFLLLTRYNGVNESILVPSESTIHDSEVFCSEVGAVSNEVHGGNPEKTSQADRIDPNRPIGMLSLTHYKPDETGIRAPPT